MVHDLQKANMWKRISAYIFDSILLITVAVGVAALLSGLFGFDTHTAERQRLRQDYETRYGVSFDVEWDSYEALPEEERLKQEEAYAAFAPENALEPVRQAVSHVVPSVYCGGMERAFRIAAEQLHTDGGPDDRTCKRGEE